MMMVPFDSKHKTKKEGKIVSMPKQFFRIMLTLGKANAFNEKGEIKRGAHFIAGSDLSNLIKYVLGGKTEKPKHLLAFQNILKEYGITDEAVKDRKTKKALINKGNKKKPFVNEIVNESDPETIIGDWSSSDDE